MSDEYRQPHQTNEKRASRRQLARRDYGNDPLERQCLRCPFRVYQPHARAP